MSALHWNAVERWCKSPVPSAPKSFQPPKARWGRTWESPKTGFPKDDHLKAPGGSSRLPFQQPTWEPFWNPKKAFFRRERQGTSPFFGSMLGVKGSKNLPGDKVILQVVKSAGVMMQAVLHSMNCMYVFAAARDQGPG